MVDVKNIRHYRHLIGVRLIYSSLKWREITDGTDVLDVKEWWKERRGVSI
jgi:hypothetical protein